MAAYFERLENVAREIREEVASIRRPRSGRWPYPRRSFEDAAPATQRSNTGVKPSKSRG